MDFKDIKRIVELMNEHGLSHFRLEVEGSTLEMKKGPDLEAVQKMMSFAPPAYLQAAPAAPAGTAPVASSAGSGSAPSTPSEGGLPPGVVEIKSILVGTFFRSPSPDAEVFVAEGSEVSEDTVVCIVEAMKVMNQIQAGVRGRILKVLVENGTPVQYGDPLFQVKLA